MTETLLNDFTVENGSQPVVWFFSFSVFPTKRGAAAAAAPPLSVWLTLIFLLSWGAGAGTEQDPR